MQKRIRILRKSGIEEILIDNLKPAILVGTSKEEEYARELDEIANLARSAGHDVYRTKDTWPRTLYSVLGDLYIPACEFGNSARGGAYIFGGSFVLASEGVSNRYGISDLSKMFQGLKTYLLPPLPQFSEGKENSKEMLSLGRISVYEDLDYFAALIRRKNLLVVDEMYYERNRALFDKIVADYRLEILSLPHSEFLHYPANFLEIGSNGKTQVIMNGCAIESVKLLREKGVEVLTGLFTALTSGENERGAVTCATNIAHDKRILTYLGVELA